MQPAEVTAAPVQVGAPARFSAGRALSASFEVWASNIPFFIGVAVLAQLPGFLFSTLEVSQGGITPTGNRIEGMLDVLLSYVATGLVTTSVLDRLRGRPVDARRSLSVGAANLGPLLGTSIATWFLTALLFVLLVVPGAIATVRWCLVAPVAVTEPDALPRKRSSELTAGHGWELFGLLFVFRAGLVGATSAVVAVVDSGNPYLDNLLATLPGPLFLSFQSVLDAVLYEHLRAEKEGVDVGQLTAVFE